MSESFGHSTADAGPVLVWGLPVSAKAASSILAIAKPVMASLTAYLLVRKW